uniref:uncharacterized protein At4g26485-like n=1 Tax=Fragaria vesca subsp. vesca TaxID=101020 RepID=UPI0005C9B282|nr:PREDICTED: uncharacterized protein At4g26485-like [Fragaria vesca subsp. vesca]
MVATSLNSRDELMENYSNAMSHLEKLEEKGCTILHEVDVHTMSRHPYLAFNSAHKKLVKGYFRSARKMLSSRGQIHVTHKTTYPFSKWEKVDIAKDAGLYLVEEETFFPWQYPGYVNKRGSGKCDETFSAGSANAFKFVKYKRYSRIGCHEL